MKKEQTSVVGRVREKRGTKQGIEIEILVK